MDILRDQWRLGLCRRRRLISMSMSRVILWSVISATSLSCESPSPPEGLFGAQQLNDRSEDDRTLDQYTNEGEAEYLPTLKGAWLHYSQVSTCVDIGSSLEQFNRSLYVVQVEQTEHGGLIERWEACEIDLTPVISVRARIPEALRQRVYPIETAGGLIVGTPPNQRYLSSPLVELWGVEMANPLVDDMPVSGEDDRIFDMDEDGEVGVTLEIGDACLAYMSQRRVTSYQGEFTSPDTIEGVALSVTEQLIIDASAPICKTSYQTRSNPDRSRFIRIRVDGQGGSMNIDTDRDGIVSCDELSEMRDELFINRLMITELDHEQCQR